MKMMTIREKSKLCETDLNPLTYKINALYKLVINVLRPFSTTLLMLAFTSY